MANSEDEHILVSLVQSGDMAAFEKLLLRLYRPMRNYVVKLGGVSIVDDVLQEMALKIYEQIKSLRDIKAFRPWAYRIATRITFVHLKREKRWRDTEADVQRLAAQSGMGWHEPELEPELLNMVDRISPASRAVLLLRYQEDLSLEETAAILDIPLGTAKSRMHYAVTKLREFMKEKQSK